jgi:DNA-binding LacI/PurR family transcriptional regulator
VEKQGKRRVTAADVARSLGLSRATVGFVLNNTPGQTISASTRDRVLAEAARLGYRPHLAARTLASGQSRIILLVLPDWPLDYAMRTHLDEASLALDEAGYSLVTMTPHAGGSARPLWETLQPDLVMGMVPFSPEQAALIAASGTPTISPDATPALGADLDYDRGPELQVRHLVERGHRRLVFANTGDRRLAALAEERESLARATATTAEVPMRVDVVDDSNAADLVAEWSASGTTAVAAYNDDIAALVVGAALRSGVDVPGKLAVIGHDDTPISRLMVPALSSIHVDAAGLGRYFAALALHAVDGTPAPVAPPATRAALIVRESS